MITHSINAWSILRGVIPPAVWSLARHVRDRAPWRRPVRHEWEYVPQGWREATQDLLGKGWDDGTTSDTHAATWPMWVRALEGAGMLGIDFGAAMRAQRSGMPGVPVGEPWAHNSVMSYAYALALAARKKDRISILDWGGGVGQFFPLSKALLPSVEFEYWVRDVPGQCAAGRELNPDVHFCDDDRVWTTRRFDFVLSSSALQFTQHWPELVRRLASVTAGYMFITRLPIVFRSPSFVVVQRAGYARLNMEFLGWFLNRNEFLACASSAQMKLIREFVMMDKTPVHGAPEQAVYRAFLFQPSGSSGQA